MTGTRIASTLVGDYNPDWAIAFVKGTVQHIYFVAETKGSLSPMQLRGVEFAKIACARRFFESLNAKQTRPVQYGVVTDYATLISLAGQKCLVGVARTVERQRLRMPYDLAPAVRLESAL